MIFYDYLFVHKTTWFCHMHGFFRIQDDFAMIFIQYFTCICSVCNKTYIQSSLSNDSIQYGKKGIL